MPDHGGSCVRGVDQFIPLVAFLGEFLGKNCEVVLHDVSNKEHSVLALANSHISGRTEGAPLTDLALQFLARKVYAYKDWVMGYSTYSQTGGKLYSATYFIRDIHGEVCGMLCLNMDCSDIIQARDILDVFLQARGEISCKNKILDTHEDKETFSMTIEELTDGIIQNVVMESGIPPERMTTSEKMEIMEKLHDRGVFLLKGAIREVALALSASEATIYRYLQKISSDQDE